MAMTAPKAAPAAVAEAPLVGVMTSRTTQVVAAQIDGRIKSVAAISGKRVKAGDPIAEIDSKQLEDRLAAAKAAVDVAKAGIAGAGAEIAEADRQVALETRVFRAGAAPEESVRLARAQLARASAAGMRAQADLRQAEANRAEIETELEHTHITAPCDGVVSLVKMQQGEVVGPGAVIARVFDPDKLMVRFQVTRARRLDVTTNTTITLTVPGVGSVQAKVASVSADLEPPLDFAVAEADVVGPAPDIQIGTVGDVRVVR